MNISDKLERIRALRQTLRTEQEQVVSDIREKLESIPESEIMTRLSPIAFTIPFSALDLSDWSPKHYDISEQRRLALAAIERCKGDMGKIADVIGSILASDRIDKGGRQFVRLNKTMRPTLTEIYDSLANQVGMWDAV